MKTGYRIVKVCSEWNLGNVTKTLGNDNQFYLALCNTKYFDSVQCARTAWNCELASKHYIRGTDHVAIVGPRNGWHRIGSRH